MTNAGAIKYKPSEGGLATGLGSVYKQSNNIWIGWPGNEITAVDMEEQVWHELALQNMRPVFYWLF